MHTDFLCQILILIDSVLCTILGLEDRIFYVELFRCSDRIYRDDYHDSLGSKEKVPLDI